MLQVMRRGGGSAASLLTAEHDAVLRAAFGRAGRQAARAAAAIIVNEHHSVGRWFTCDCLGDMKSPPVLVPVIGSFIRRHVEGRWPEHAEWCDFYRDPSAQAAVSASYRLQAATGLVRAFAGEPTRLRPDVSHCGTEHRRSRLARMLFKLLHEAGLATFRYGQAQTIKQQYTAMRRAAASLQLEDVVQVSSALCTYRPALEEFFDKVAAMPEASFRKTRNPHGLLVDVARSASKGVIEPVQGEPLQVAGKISIFGERDGRDAGPGLSATRGPYLMVCLVGRRAPKARVEVLRAYLHPCMSVSWLFPVDSDLERQTMMRLVASGRWFRDLRGFPLTIQKPLWDLAEAPQVLPSGEIEAHEPILPDFIVQVGEGAAARRVVVETMGYAHAAYRARKHRLRPEMERLAGAPVVEHDFHLPAEWSQRQRDGAFSTSCRQALLGSRSSPSGGDD